jgi:hypothetical protein
MKFVPIQPSIAFSHKTPALSLLSLSLPHPHSAQ